jgi:hypothetical protein
MMKKILSCGFLLCMGSAALAQQAAPASPYAALVDQPTCTRAELEAATDSYVAAQKKGAIAGMALHEKARFLENMSDVAKDKGLWNTALPVALDRSFHDSKRCKTFTEMVVTEGGHPYVIGTRLYMHEGKIIRVDSLVTDQGDWLFNANAYLKFASKENWDKQAEPQRTVGQTMINGANAYLDSFSDKFTDAPWGTPCERLEGGAYTNAEGKADSSCKVGIPAGVLYIVNRDYLIDEEKGVINIFCRFGNSTNGMPDSHTFRYVSGKFRSVHTLSVNLGATPSPQANDNGGMVR